MKSRTILLGERSDASAVQAELVRLGAEPKALEDAGRVVGFTATLDDVDTARIARTVGVERVLSTKTAYPRVARRGEGTRVVELPHGVVIGGDAAVVIAGPCAVESREQ